MKNSLIILAMLFTFSCTTLVDVAMVEEELLKIDIEFSNYSAENGFVKAFEAYCAEDGVILRPDTPPVVGSKMVMQELSEMDDSEFIATWEPQFARASESGELGYTYGIYTIKSLDKEVMGRGTYVTIWEKKEEGWKFLLDSGNEGLGD